MHAPSTQSLPSAQSPDWHGVRQESAKPSPSEEQTKPSAHCIWSLHATQSSRAAGITHRFRSEHRCDAGQSRSKVQSLLVAAGTQTDGERSWRQVQPPGHIDSAPQLTVHTAAPVSSCAQNPETQPAEPASPQLPPKPSLDEGGASDAQPTHKKMPKKSIRIGIYNPDCTIRVSVDLQGHQR